VLTSFTCPYFEEVEEPVYRARWDMMQQFGEVSAVTAMMQQKQEEHEDARSDVPHRA
jgi:hypothetical protein